MTSAQPDQPPYPVLAVLSLSPSLETSDRQALRIGPPGSSGSTFWLLPEANTLFSSTRRRIAQLQLRNQAREPAIQSLVNQMNTVWTRLSADNDQADICARRCRGMATFPDEWMRRGEPPDQRGPLYHCDPPRN